MPNNLFKTLNMININKLKSVSVLDVFIPILNTQRKHISLKMLLLGIIVITLSCNAGAPDGAQNLSDKATAEYKPGSKLEVMYFHATMRCVTCNAVEDNTKKMIETLYAEQYKNGDVSFVSINVDDEKNKAIAEKYEISFSTLLLKDNTNEEPTVKDFTEIAFQYANTNPEKYNELLKQELDKVLTH